MALNLEVHISDMLFSSQSFKYHHYNQNYSCFQIRSVGMSQSSPSDSGRRLRHPRGRRGAPAQGQRRRPAAGVRAAAPLPLRLHPHDLHAVPDGATAAASGCRGQYEDTFLWVSWLRYRKEM